MGINQAKKAEYDGKPTRKAKAKVSGGTGESATWRGYVKYERTKEVKTHFETWAADWEMVTEALDTAASMGFKLSTGYNPDDDSFRAQWYSSDPSRDDAGLAISAFALTLWDAQVLATFFLAVKGAFNLTSPAFTPPDVKSKKSFWD